MSFPGVIGRKRGMTQVFQPDGSAVPVTVVELLPMTVTQIKSPEKEGYSSVQFGYGAAKEKHLPKARRQHLLKNQLPLFRCLMGQHASSQRDPENHPRVNPMDHHLKCHPTS